MATKNEQDFKEHVTSICLEINSDCNRKCVYCPHSLIKRPETTMEISILKKILRELEKIRYNGWICLNNYNEPLLHYPFLLTVMAEIKKSLPDSKINFSTNGDFLTKDILEELSAHGLAKLTVTCHQNTYSREKAEKLVKNMLHTLEIKNAPLTVKKNSVVSKVHYTSGGGTIPLRIFSSNFLINGQNRANSLKNIVTLPASYKRNKACLRPVTQAVISYDGSVYPCCMFFHGIAEKKYLLGNCATDSLFDIYAHPLSAHFKKMGALAIPFESPCAECTD